MAKRKRRGYTNEFKAETVRLIHESGKCIAVVARELDLTESAVRAWVRQAGIDAGHGPAGALTTVEREELGRLRREIRTVRMERDILNSEPSDVGDNSGAIKVQPKELSNKPLHLRYGQGVLVDGLAM